MTRYRISTHFVVEEFDCRDGTKVPPQAHEALRWWAEAWGEPLRFAFGPVRVTSGFRTPAYNRSVGGAPQSFHVYTLRYAPAPLLKGQVGVAADVVPAGGTVADWSKWAAARIAAGIPRLGPGRGAAHGYVGLGFIHLDTGPTRTWVG